MESRACRHRWSPHREPLVTGFWMRRRRRATHPTPWPIGPLVRRGRAPRFVDEIPRFLQSPVSPSRAGANKILSAPSSPVSLAPGSTGRSLLCQASIGTRKMRGQWWAPVELGIDFVPDSQDGSGGECIFIPDSEVDFMALFKKRKIGEKAAEDEAIKQTTTRQAQQKRFRRRYELLPPLEPELRKWRERRGAYLKLKPVNAIEAAAVDEHNKPGVDIGGHSQADDDFLLDNESQSQTWSGSMFKSGKPPQDSAGPTASVSSCGPPSPIDVAAARMPPLGPPSPPASACAAGMFWAKRPPASGRWNTVRR